MKLIEGYEPPRDLRRLFAGYFSCKSGSSPSSAQLASAGETTPLTQKVTLAVWPTWRQTAVLWGARWDWDAVANGDGVVPHQNVFDHEPYDSLALCDIKRRRRLCCAVSRRFGS